MKYIYIFSKGTIYAIFQDKYGAINDPRVSRIVRALRFTLLTNACVSLTHFSWMLAEDMKFLIQD